MIQIFQYPHETLMQISSHWTKNDSIEGYNDIEKFVGFSVELFSSLDKVVKYLDHEAFHELMSSIFEEKLEFEDKNYRTPKLNPSIKYMYQEMNKLVIEKQKTEDKISNVSRSVLGAGLEPARTLLFIGF